MLTANDIVEKYNSLLEARCRPGFKMKAGTCVRMSSQEKRNRKRAAKITARKLRKRKNYAVVDGKKVSRYSLKGATDPAPLATYTPQEKKKLKQYKKKERELVRKQKARDKEGHIKGAGVITTAAAVAGAAPAVAIASPAIATAVVIGGAVAGAGIASHILARKRNKKLKGKKAIITQ